MKKLLRVATRLAFAGLVFATISAPSRGTSKPGPGFRYVAGTESLSKGCDGTLEITDTALVFACPEGSIAAPFDSITLMEYRTKVSKAVRQAKFKWAVRPSSSGSRQDAYFTVLYGGQGRTHAMILRVSPDTMRPYLAEIDLRAGRRVDVQPYRLRLK